MPGVVEYSRRTRNIYTLKGKRVFRTAQGERALATQVNRVGRRRAEWARDSSRRKEYDTGLEIETERLDGIGLTLHGYGKNEIVRKEEESLLLSGMKRMGVRVLSLAVGVAIGYFAGNAKVNSYITEDSPLVGRTEQVDFIMPYRHSVVLHSNDKADKMKYIGGGIILGGLAGLLVAGFINATREDYVGRKLKKHAKRVEKEKFIPRPVHPS